MGCYSMTDGVTQLPVNSGDKVRLFVLQSASKNISNSACYSTDIWSPVGCISGFYDDYGGIENVDKDLNYNLLLQYFQENVSDDMTVENAFDLIHYDKLKSKQGNNFAIMFVLEEVFQTMINFNNICANFDVKKYYYEPRNTILLNRIYKFYNDSFEKYQEIKGDKPPEFMWVAQDHSLFINYQYFFAYSYKNLLIEYIKEGRNISDEKVSEAINSFYDIFRFCGSMEWARKLFTPQSGAGSQENSLEIYKFLAKTTQNICKQREKKLKEDGFDIPDKNGYYPYMKKRNKELNK